MRWDAYLWHAVLKVVHVVLQSIHIELDRGELVYARGSNAKRLLQTLQHPLTVSHERLYNRQP